MAVVNFEKASLDIQIGDLYLFLRKILEKQNYDLHLGRKMLAAYESVKPLEYAEREYLSCRLRYPEKFWKLADSYYCSNKAWVPAKNLEKLKTVVTQTEEKSRFLERLFSFSL